MNLATLRSWLSVTKHVGENANERKRLNGNQYQNWVKTSNPTTAIVSFCPLRVNNDTVTFRPPRIIIII